MALIQFLKDELKGNVDILDSGAISTQSIFLKKFVELGGDKNYLYSLIEDYIFTNEDGETFDAVKLIEEYEEKIKENVMEKRRK